MIKCILIDDEPHNLEILELLLNKNCPNITVIAKASCADKGIELITKHQPDLVFLDIEMPNKNGFEVLKNLEIINFEVIFVTAYNKYVLQAIKSCALDYLMKPVAINELVLAVEKVTTIVREKKENQKLKILVENLKNTNNPQKIALPTAEELYFIATKDIIRCKGENNYTKFFLTNNTSILVSKTLKEWEDLLTSHQFIRTHQSHLINSLHVKSYVKKDGGYILMNDGSIVSVSKHRKENTLTKLTTLK
jgi:two-component system LytT family response regulator